MQNKTIHTPEGVRDIYGKELLKKRAIKDKLHNTLSLYGFKDIETPSFEFSDVYLTTPEKEMYRFFDKEGNMLVLRPDFTPAIARCASKYFVDDSMPIRLTYEGNVFNNTNDLQGKLKESTQMGAELIEENGSAASDAEMLCLVIESLLNIGFKEFLVSLGHAGYFKGICEAAAFNDEIITNISDYLSAKNYFGAEEYLESLNTDKRFLEGILGAVNYTKISDITNARQIVDNQTSLDALSYLEKVYEYVAERGYEKYISFDLSLLSNFKYYTGVIFRAYTYGTGDAIVKGGRYDCLLSKFGKSANAVGFVFMVDDIMTALSSLGIIENPKPSVYWVVYNEDKAIEAYKKINDNRKNGINTAAIIYDINKTKDDYLEYAEKNDIAGVEFYI